MASIEETIEVDVPVSTAYNQWTQFEEFPKFMEGIESVRQLDDTHLLWSAEVGGEAERSGGPRSPSSILTTALPGRRRRGERTRAWSRSTRSTKIRRG